MAMGIGELIRVAGIARDGNRLARSFCRAASIPGGARLSAALGALGCLPCFASAASGSLRSSSSPAARPARSPRRRPRRARARARASWQARTSARRSVRAARSRRASWAPAYRRTTARIRGAASSANRSTEECRRAGMRRASRWAMPSQPQFEAKQTGEGRLVEHGAQPTPPGAKPDAPAKAPGDVSRPNAPTAAARAWQDTLDRERATGEGMPAPRSER